MNDIFDYDFFEDAIEDVDMYDDDYDYYDEAYEDVDMFDENYFEANEGNPINKGRKKIWEYSQATKQYQYGDNSDKSEVDDKISKFRRGNYAYPINDREQLQKRHLKDYERDTRDRRLARNPGYSSTISKSESRLLRNSKTYDDRYSAAKSRIAQRNLDNANAVDIYNRTVPAKFRKNGAPYMQTSHKNVVREMNHPSKR